MILMRRLLGDVLRQRRQRDGRTLRQVAAAARISPGYLSEIERGQKEPSSELLASISDALDVRLSDLMREVSGELAAAELATGQVPAVSVPSPQVPTTDKIPATKITARPTGTPVAVSGAKPGARSMRRPAPRPVTRPVPPVPVGASTVPSASAAGLTTNLPMALSLTSDLAPAGPAGVPGVLPGGFQVLMANDLFVSA
jgi:transcriptional regulator with XRE-family HTH domain